MTQDSHMTVKCALQGLWSVFQNVHHTFVTINWNLNYPTNSKKQSHS